LKLRHSSLLPQRSPHCKYDFRIIPFSPTGRNYRARSGGLHFFAATGTSPAEWIKAHHTRVTHVHLKDRKANNGPNVPWGQGDTPIREILLMMKKEKYRFQATIEMEYPVPEGSTLLTEIARCVRYCKDILA
jgi:sugar phosphate isomerase/epimerase